MLPVSYDAPIQVILLLFIIDNYIDMEISIKRIGNQPILDPTQIMNAAELEKKFGIELFKVLISIAFFPPIICN